ncbi:unnamed protein product [Urochloa humidicola]
MELATAALSSLLPKLGSLLTAEYKLQRGLRGEIRFLQAEMESMQAALDTVSKLPADKIDGVHKIWARDLKELVYDIEDSVDAFMVRVDAPVHAKPNSFRRFFESTMGLLTKAKNRHRITDDIQDIKRRIQEVADRRKRYRFETAVQSDRDRIDPRVLACFEDAAKLVGTDGPVEKISNMLTGGKGVPNKKLMVVSIVGVGGLGKTTIANLVYERIGGQFDCQAFVSMSLKPDMKNILSKILRQVSQDKCTNAGEKDLDELIRSIRKFLIDKRYFIVIDDLWDKEAWENIKYVLVDMNIGSRVIVTTRNNDVANFSSIDGEVYELDPLSYEDSRRLLCKRVFNEEEGIYSELEEVTKKILKKCGGIPLAITTIASMLASIPNRTKYEWHRVYNSMGSGLERDKTLDNMRNILHLSYSDLPTCLKPCLLYLSMFPEDYKIQKSDLVRLWVAEGFVIGKLGTDSYDTGERYFNELVNRSMIMPVDIDKYAVASACRVHDMVLDLIINISAQENFCTISEGPHNTSTSTYFKIRRISLKSKQKTLQATDNMSSARSLIVLYDGVTGIPPLSTFSVLRVLSIEGIRGNIIIHTGLGRLHHLRYLKLGGRVELELLEGIGNLKVLKTLDLSEAPKGKLPACIVQLHQLEHLLMNRTMKFPDGIGNLTSLQELSVINVDKSPNTLAELGKLSELRVLTIKGFRKAKSYLKTFLQSLSSLGNLRTLKFDDFSGSGSLNRVSGRGNGPTHLQVFNGGGITFYELPRWFSSLYELSNLSISIEVLRHVDLQLLGALPALCFLVLHVHPNGTTEQQMVIGNDHPFCSLVEFRFLHNSRCSLVFEQGVMPSLRRLELYFEAREKMGGGFVVGLENLTSLQQVTVQVDCYEARIGEVEDAETKIWDAVDSHPNNPKLVLSRLYEKYMAKDDNEDEHASPEHQSVT